MALMTPHDSATMMQVLVKGIFFHIALGMRAGSERDVRECCQNGKRMRRMREDWTKRARCFEEEDTTIERYSTTAYA